MFLLGCASANKGKIEGTKWSSKAATVKGKSIPAGALGLEFRSDGGLVYRIGPQTLSGTSALGGGDTVTFRLNQELAGRKTHAEKIAIGEDQLTLTDSDGAHLIFERAK